MPLWLLAALVLILLDGDVVGHGVVAALAQRPGGGLLGLEGLRCHRSKTKKGDDRFLHAIGALVVGDFMMTA